jgi:hypothetical protein
MASDSETTSTHSDSALTAIGIAALIGAFIGGIWMPNWHVAVESGQVVAGLIKYPNDNPFYYYHLKAWTVLHQICAVFLKIGISAKALSVLVSMCLGASLMGSLSWLTWILCRKTGWSIIAPLLMFYVLRIEIEYGVAYPIFLFGSHHTYGTTARIYVLITFLCMAAGHRRIAWAMLGFSPAIHMTWGAFAWAMGLGMILWERWYTKEALKGILPWFLLGVVFVWIPYQLILLQASELPVVPKEVQTEHLKAFFTHWDFHRQESPLIHPGIALTLMMVAVNAWILRRYPSLLDEQSSRLLKVMTIAGVGGLIGCFAAHYPQYLPDLINMGMPVRYINLVIMVYPVVLVGVCVKFGDEIPEAKWLLFAYMVYLISFQLVLAFSKLEHIDGKPIHWISWSLLGACVFFIPFLKKIPLTFNDKWTTYSLRIVIPIMVIAFSLGFRNDWKKQLFLLNAPVDRVMEAARAGEGMIITHSAMQLVQLMTGRPVMVNTGGLDQIAHMPATAPAIAEIFDTVYGIDFFDPPDDIKKAKPATLLPQTGFDTWEARSREEWRDIARQYGATQILAIDFAPLDLEVAEKKGTLILYNLPK